MSNRSAGPARHTLRVAVDGTSVVLGIDCHEPPDADCRTTLGGCLVAEQADEGVAFAEYHDGDREPLADGMRIVAGWSTADECYTWHGYLEDAAAAPHTTATVPNEAVR